MSAEKFSKPRPYWHVDAKWITGLLLVFSLSVTLLIYGLVQITAEEPAVDLMTLSLALMFSRDGLDNESEFDEFQRLFEASPDHSLTPIPGLSITIREDEIQGLSPREARLYLFRKWAEPAYRGGAEGLAELAEDPELKAQIIEGGAMFDVLTLKTHLVLRRALMIAASVSLVLLLPLVFFSFRFGRVGNPGCVLFVASLPGAVLFTFAGLAIKPLNTPPAEEAGMTGMISYLLSNVLPAPALMISRGFLISLALGVGLMLIAVLSRLTWRLMRRARAQQSAE